MRKNIIILSIILCGDLHARWGTPDDASIEIVKNVSHIKINKDGTSTMVTDRYMKVLNEEARQILATQLLTYDESYGNMKVLEAETIVGDKKYPVAKDKIEIKPLASEAHALRKDLQILIPFQNVNVGSIVHMKYEENTIETPLPDYYAASWNFDSNYFGKLWSHWEVTIESELPLESKINDPTKSLEITHQGKNKFTVKLAKPIIRKLVGEPDLTYIKPADQTYFAVSTEKDYNRCMTYFANKYDEVLKAPLPARFEKLRQQAESIKDEKQQIDNIVIGLIEQIHYLGNWDTAGGHLIPRQLEEIANTGYGDCKDYSTALTAILRKLGYQAFPTEVNRGINYTETDSLPDLTNTNHIIVKAISKSGTVYWIDPTNTTAMAGSIYDDIADRPCYVLDQKKPQVERIPAVDHTHSTIERSETLSINSDGLVSRTGTVSCRYESAEQLTRKLISAPANEVEDILISSLCEHEPNSRKIDLPKNLSRKVTDFTFDYNLVGGKALMRTNNGYGLSLINQWSQTFFNTPDNQVGTKILDDPMTVVVKIIYKNLKADNLESLNFSIKSPWINVERKFENVGGNIVMTERRENLKNRITAEEIQSAEFKKLKQELEKNCQNVAIILSK